MVAGCVGAFVGTPAEVALIRMTADGRLSIGKFSFFYIMQLLYILYIYTHIAKLLKNLNIFNVLNAAERRNYKNVFDALFRIIKEEGLFTLWRGAIPTMGRAMVVNAAQLASYSQAKQALLDTGMHCRNIK